jgi:hypothetical protein
MQTKTTQPAIEIWQQSYSAPGYQPGQWYALLDGWLLLGPRGSRAEIEAAVASQSTPAAMDAVMDRMIAASVQS